jgi:hypothetical protein
MTLTDALQLEPRDASLKERAKQCHADIKVERESRRPWKIRRQELDREMKDLKKDSLSGVHLGGWGNTNNATLTPSSQVDVTEPDPTPPMNNDPSTAWSPSGGAASLRLRDGHDNGPLQLPHPSQDMNSESVPPGDDTTGAEPETVDPTNLLQLDFDFNFGHASFGGESNAFIPFESMNRENIGFSTDFYPTNGIPPGPPPVESHSPFSLPNPYIAPTPFQLEPGPPPVEFNSPFSLPNPYMAPTLFQLEPLSADLEPKGSLMADPFGHVHESLWESLHSDNLGMEMAGPTQHYSLPSSLGMAWNNPPVIPPDNLDAVQLPPVVSGTPGAVRGAAKVGGSLLPTDSNRRGRGQRDEVNESDILPEGSRRSRGKSARLLAALQHDK